MKVNSLISYYTQPAFLICVTVLLIGAAGKQILIAQVGGYLEKEPLPLKKSLEFLDENPLGSYKVLSKEKISNEEVIKSLGTEEYIEWILEDTEVSQGSKVRKCLLFITYYELPDMVPHVPEECYVGGGNQLIDGQKLTIEMNTKDYSRNIPVKYLLFNRKNEGIIDSYVKVPVFYLINADNFYANSRSKARFLLNMNFFRKHSYFSKVEWQFFNNTEFNRQIYPDKEDALLASQKLLRTILPLLEQKHWPSLQR